MIVGNEERQTVCPTCDNEYETENAMKAHHKKVHNESIAGVLVRCDRIGCDTVWRRGRWGAERDRGDYCSDECLNTMMKTKMSGEGNPQYGETWSEETREKMKQRDFPTGEDHWNWKGGEAKRHTGFYASKKWKEFSREIKERDGFTCSYCGEKGGNLQAHHIEPVSLGGEKYPPKEKMITLCYSCHQENFKRWHPDQLEDYISNNEVIC